MKDARTIPIVQGELAISETKSFECVGCGRIDYHEFLSIALPNDFQRAPPEFQPLEAREEWVKWNTFRNQPSPGQIGRAHV